MLFGECEKFDLTDDADVEVTEYPSPTEMETDADAQRALEGAEGGKKSTA